MAYTTTTEIGIKAQALVDLLKTASVGETITFDQMSSQLGQDVRRIRYVIEVARRVLLAEHSMRFDSVFSVGLKRMNLEDAIGVADRTLAKARRMARNESRRVNTQLAGANDVDDRTRFALNARLSVLGAVAELAAPKTVKLVSANADERVIPFGRVLELFR